MKSGYTDIVLRDILNLKGNITVPKFNMTYKLSYIENNCQK